MKSLRDVVHQAIADAFAAGAEWHAIVGTRQDSAQLSRESKHWPADHRYAEELRRQQQTASEAVARAIMRLTLEAGPRHTSMFGE